MTTFPNDISALRLTVTGSVQGIGYRPFVRREALSRSLSGYVQNSGGGVCIYACGEKEALDSFVRCLRVSPPQGTVYTSFEVTEAECKVCEGFDIAESDSRAILPMVSPDLAPCTDCVHELFDRSNRRYRHPFISCAICGPRFSIQSALPYDRVRTGMGGFALCDACADEYNAVDGRRSYAQSLACHHCGPRLEYRSGGQRVSCMEALDACISHLRAGGIDAIKNVGGFHLACRADDQDAVSALRALKGREEKPFALLFADIDAIRAAAHLSEAEEALLTSPARPIVLLRRKNDGGIAPSVCRESLYVGAMLPSSPIQHLLAHEVGILVMTSANRSGEPLCKDVSELDWLPQTVGILDNDRPIVLAQDDSVAFAADCAGQAKSLLLRRARGYAPLPIRLPKPIARPTLASGGDLKAVFALARGEFVYPSPYLGDLGAIASSARWSETEAHMCSLFDIAPTALVCDLHPTYFSSKLAQKALESGKNDGNIPQNPIKVQHHHAHIASVMAEHSLDRVLGFAFDGTGYGEDGTVWGGELLFCEGAKYERLMHLKALPMLGGDSGAVDCRRTASAFLLASGKEPWDGASRILKAALQAEVNCLPTSSMGRLFDAAASILGICQFNAYEGQAATMLEAVAVGWRESGGAAAALALNAEADEWRSDRLLLDLLARKENGEPIGSLALGFHYALADALVKAAEKYSRICETSAVALSGGCFANRLLLSECFGRLSALGMDVYINEALPAGDGNIALGQAYIAALRDSE